MRLRGGADPPLRSRTSEAGWRLSACPERPRAGRAVAVYWDGDDRLYPGAYDGRGGIDFEGRRRPGGRGGSCPCRRGRKARRQAVRGTDARVLTGLRRATPSRWPRRLPTAVPRWDFRDRSQRRRPGRISEYLDMALFRDAWAARAQGLRNFSDSKTRLFLCAVVFRGEDPN